MGQPSGGAGEVSEGVNASEKVVEIFLQPEQVGAVHRRKFGLRRDDHPDHLPPALAFHALATFGGAEQAFSDREEHKDIAARLPLGFGPLDRGREFDS